MPTYHFTITLAGTGKNEQEAWEDAVEGFYMEPGPIPEDSHIVEENEEV